MGEDSSHGQGQSSLLIRCCLHVAGIKRSGNSHIAIVLSGKFPGFTASFPGVESKSARFGQNVPIVEIEVENFAAKFADEGNLFTFTLLASL